MCLWRIVVIGMISAVESLAAEAPPIVIAYDDLPRLVREKNENVQAAHLGVQAHEARTGRLTRSFLPHIGARIGTEEFKSDSEPLKRQGYWKVEGSINLYRGGRDLMENDIRKSNVREARANYILELSDELKEARQSFWKLIAIQKLINDRQEGLIKNETNLKSARRRAGAGIATAADAVQFELQRTLLTQELKKMQLQRDLLKNQLSVAVGLDEHESIQLKGDFPHPDKGEPTIAALETQNHSGITVLTERQNAEKLKGRQAAQWWQPKVDVYSSYGVPALTDDYDRALKRDNEWSVGIRLGVDLGQGLDDRNEARARALEAESLAKRTSHRIREVIAVDHELRHDLKLIHELIHDADRDIEKAERFLQLTESEYARGVKNGPDLLNAFQKLFEFRQRRTELYRDYYLSQSELLSIVAKEGS